MVVNVVAALVNHVCVYVSVSDNVFMLDTLNANL